MTDGHVDDSDKSVGFVYLSQEEVIAAGGLDMNAVIEAVETAFRLHGQGDVVQPVKPVLRWGGPETEETTGRIMAMPSYLGGDLGVAGIKWIPSKPENPRKYGLPRASALIVLNDPDTGLPLAVMDGTVVSAMRTGAVTGVGAKYLARPDAATVAVIGSGVQGRTQLLALQAAVRDIREVRIYDLDPAKARAYAESMGCRTGLRIVPADSARQAITGADILVTATVGTTSYVEKEWIGEGVFHSEISFWDTRMETLPVYDKIVVDDWQQIEHHGVDVSVRAVRAGIITPDRICAEMGQIVCGRKPGRENARERIMLNTIGLSIHDVAVAYMVYRNALRQNLGTRLKLWDRPAWI